MHQHAISQSDYVRQVLQAYRQTPSTTGKVRRTDRLFAVQLHLRGVPLLVVENALLLAAARRLLRPASAPPLAPVRSLAYVQPIIEEVLAQNPSQDYFLHVRQRLQQFLATSSHPL